MCKGFARSILFSTASYRLLLILPVIEETGAAALSLARNFNLPDTGTMIPDAVHTELKALVAQADSSREAAIEVMQRLQRHYGWLTDEAVGEASALLGLTPLQIEELATFYDMIYRRPVGRHVIHVCDSISCWSLGGDTLMDRFCRLLGIEPGATTADGMYTLLPCSCLGNCASAPAVMVGERQFGPVTPDSCTDLLDMLRTLHG